MGTDPLSRELNLNTTGKFMQNVLKLKKKKKCTKQENDCGTLAFLVMNMAHILMSISQLT